MMSTLRRKKRRRKNDCGETSTERRKRRRETLSFEPLWNLVEELADDDEIEFSADDDVDRINSMMSSHMSPEVEEEPLEEDSKE
jgi:hypothetical protein